MSREKFSVLYHIKFQSLSQLLMHFTPGCCSRKRIHVLCSQNHTEQSIHPCSVFQRGWWQKCFTCAFGHHFRMCSVWVHRVWAVSAWGQKQPLRHEELQQELLCCRSEAPRSTGHPNGFGGLEFWAQRQKLHCAVMHENVSRLYNSTSQTAVIRAGSHPADLTTAPTDDTLKNLMKKQWTYAEWMRNTVHFLKGLNSSHSWEQQLNMLRHLNLDDGTEHDYSGTIPTTVIKSLHFPNKILHTVS